MVQLPNNWPPIQQPSPPPYERPSPPPFERPWPRLY